MIISKTSWHYRLNTKKSGSYKTENHKTLCSYFWFTMKNLAKVSFPVIASVVLLWCIGAVMMHDTKGPMVDWWNNNPYGILQILSYPLIGVAWCFSVVAFVGTAWGIAYCGYYISRVVCNLVLRFRYCIRKNKTETAGKKDPGLVKSYLKAHEEKYCPVIKFEE